MEWLRPSSARSNVITSASARDRMPRPCCVSCRRGLHSTTRFTRTRLSVIVHPVSSSQLTKNPDRVRSFGGYNIPGCPPDVADKRLERRRGGVGFLSCISTTSRQGYDAGRGDEREAVSVLVFKTVDEPGAPLVVPVNPNSRSVRTVRPHSQGRVMEQSFVGIDVAKDRLDVHIRPSGDTFALARDGEGVAAL